jgi:hypothetical protein
MMTPEQANQFFTDYGSVIWYIFLTAAFLAAFVKAWPFIAKVVKTVEIISSLPEKFKHVYETLGVLQQGLKAVEHEVKTNGGSSIKDAVLRIERRLDALSK